LQKLALLITPEDSLTNSKIKPLILFIGDQAKTFPQFSSSAVNRFEVIQATFPSSCD